MTLDTSSLSLNSLLIPDDQNPDGETMTVVQQEEDDDEEMVEEEAPPPVVAKKKKPPPPSTTSETLLEERAEMDTVFKRLRDTKQAHEDEMKKLGEDTHDKEGDNHEFTRATNGKCSVEPANTATSLQNSKNTNKEVKVCNPTKKDESNAILNLLCGCFGIYE